jgi:hypothetical protein
MLLRTPQKTGWRLEGPYGGCQNSSNKPECIERTFEKVGIKNREIDKKLESKEKDVLYCNG